MVKFQDKEYKDIEIAILLATYNGEKYLREQLDSLLRQSISEFICFIHDDGSVDKTMKIIEEYCDNYPQKFVYVSGKRCGGAKLNFMYLLSAVQAKYIMFCDQDDYWIDTKIEESLKSMKSLERKYGDCCPFCVYSDLIVVDEKLNTVCSSYYLYSGKIPTGNSISDLLTVNVAVGCTMMINMVLQKIALKVSNINNIFMHDWWCALICATEGQLEYISKPMVLYRQHLNNSIGARAKSGRWKHLKKLREVNEWISTKKMIIDRQRKFALELTSVIPPQNNYYNFLQALATIEDKSKLKRIWFYYKNHLYIGDNHKVLELILV